MALVVVGVVASGCTDPNTTSYDPMGAAAAEANLDLVPHEQITSCIEATKFGAYVGDADALERWNSAGQSDADLADVCNRIWRDDPTALAAIHSDWMDTQVSNTDAP